MTPEDTNVSTEEPSQETVDAIAGAVDGYTNYIPKFYLTSCTAYKTISEGTTSAFDAATQKVVDGYNTISGAVVGLFGDDGEDSEEGGVWDTVSGTIDKLGTDFNKAKVGMYDAIANCREAVESGFYDLKDKIENLEFNLNYSPEFSPYALFANAKGQLIATATLFAGIQNIKIQAACLAIKTALKVGVKAATNTAVSIVEAQAAGVIAAATMPVEAVVGAVTTMVPSLTGEETLICGDQHPELMKPIANITMGVKTGLDTVQQGISSFRENATTEITSMVNDIADQATVITNKIIEKIEKRFGNQLEQLISQVNSLPDLGIQMPSIDIPTIDVPVIDTTPFEPLINDVNTIYTKAMPVINIAMTAMENGVGLDALPLGDMTGMLSTTLGTGLGGIPQPVGELAGAIGAMNLGAAANGLV